MPDVVLTVQGVDYGGWRRVTVQRGMEQISGQFDIALSERWPGSLINHRIQPGDACILALDGQIVITGWVDSFEVSYDARQHTVRVTGRDKTGDLVDCSAMKEGGEWRDVTIRQLAEELCRPFGIEVQVVETGASIQSLPIDNTKLAGIAIQEGETVFEVLERAARMAGVLLLADGEGRLIITRADTSGPIIATHELGVNILGTDFTLDFRDRFSEYHIKGERRGTDADADDAQPIAGGSATVTDQAVRRYRPLLLVAEDLGEGVTLARRIEWERNVRAGKSIRLTHTVQSWRPAKDAPLYDINRRLTVRDEWLGVDVDLLVVGLTYRLDDGGMITEVTLTLPEALEILPEAERLDTDRPGQRQRRPKTDQFNRSKPKQTPRQSDGAAAPSDAGIDVWQRNMDDYRYR